jgi:KDO2-lipid IV(A) lauroyltransferase
MRVSESPLRDVLRVIVWYPLRWIVQALPPRAALWIFLRMGDLHCLVATGRRARVGRNYRRLVPAATEQEVHAGVREYFRNHYASQMLVMVYARLNRKGLYQLAEFEGLEHLEAATRSGRGAVLVHGHFGPEQLALVGLTLLGHPILQIGFLTDDGLSGVGRSVAFRQRRRCEDAMPGEILDARGEYRPAFRRLRNNGFVMTSGDGAGREERLGKHLPLFFFGHRILFPTGAFRMAQTAGACCLPVFVTRGERAPYRVVVEPPLAVPDGGGAAGAEAMLGAFVQRYQLRAAAEPAFMRFLDIFEPGKLIEPED